MYHVDQTINRRWSRALSTIEGEIPSSAATMAVVDAKRTTPENTQSCIVCLFLKNAVLKEIKRLIVGNPSPQSNIFSSLNIRLMTIDQCCGHPRFVCNKMSFAHLVSASFVEAQRIPFRLWHFSFGLII